MKRVFRIIFGVFSTIFVLAVIGGGLAAFFFYVRLSRDLPTIERISDYRPKAVTSIYARDGSLIAELYGERRYPVKLNDIPLMVRNAFLAAEDADFYRHPGVDLLGIIRAVIRNFLEGEVKQGASTITQQVVKSLLLSGERTYKRKAREAILAYRIEKALSKDEILEVYLNQIFFGSTAYGIKAAALIHFRKELKDLTIAEAAFLASLPHRPSELSDPEKRAEAIGRQHYVLEQMVRHNMITPAQAQEAREQPLALYPPNGPADGRRIVQAPFFVNFAEQTLRDIFAKKGELEGEYNPGGYEVHTTLDPQAYQVAQASVRRGLRAVDKRRGWRGPLRMLTDGERDAFLAGIDKSIGDGLKPEELYPAVVNEVKPNGTVLVNVGSREGVISLKQSTWASQHLYPDDERRATEFQKELKRGAVIEVSLREEEQDSGADKTKAPAEKQPEKPQSDLLVLQLDQTPEIEGALVLTNALTGEVYLTIGGYDYSRSNFNRATQSLRQPGSSFKPFIYSAAIDLLGYNPSTLVPDSPISLVAGDGKVWSPSNYDGKYLGPITLRSALEKSRNVVSVHLLNKIGVKRFINYVQRFEFSTPFQPNMSISLGSSEVKLVEQVRAYGTFAAGGWLADQLVITQIKDRNGKVVYEQRPKQKKILDDDTTFLITNIMRGVVERGTATVVKKLGRPVAGKTGTTNDFMDTWFVGFTPEWVAGVWVGFDNKKTIGNKETAGRVAAPIFLDFMQQFLEGTPVIDFEIPETIVPLPVGGTSGEGDDEEGAKSSPLSVEYYKAGSEPSATEGSSEKSAEKQYLMSNDF